MKPSDELVQLEVLYNSRGRKIDDLTKQLELLQDDYERKLRSADYEKRRLQQQNELLSSELQEKDHEIQNLQESLNEAISNLDAYCKKASAMDSVQGEVSVLMYFTVLQIERKIWLAEDSSVVCA